MKTQNNDPIVSYNPEINNEKKPVRKFKLKDQFKVQNSNKSNNKSGFEDILEKNEPDLGLKNIAIMQEKINDLLQKLSWDIDSLGQSEFSKSEKYSNQLKSIQNQTKLIWNTITIKPDLSIDDFSAHINNEVYLKLAEIYKNLIKDFNAETNSGSFYFGKKNMLLTQLNEEASNPESLIKFDQICGTFNFITNINSMNLCIESFNGDITIIQQSLKDSGVWDIDNDLFTEAFANVNNDRYITSRANEVIKNVENSSDTKTKMKSILDRLVNNVESDIKTIEDLGLDKSDKNLSGLNRLLEKVQDFKETMELNEFNMSMDKFSMYVDSKITIPSKDLYKDIVTSIDKTTNSGSLFGNNNDLLNKLAASISSGGEFIKPDKICGSLKLITNQDMVSSLVENLNSTDAYFTIKSLKDSGIWDLNADLFIHAFSNIESKNNVTADSPSNILTADLPSNILTQDLSDPTIAIGDVTSVLIDKLSLDIETINQSGLSKSEQYIEALKDLQENIKLIARTSKIGKGSLEADNIRSHLDKVIGPELSGLYKKLVTDFDAEKNSGLFSQCFGFQNQVLKNLVKETSRENPSVKFDKICGILNIVTQTGGIKNALPNLSNIKIKSISESLISSGLAKLSFDNLNEICSNTDILNTIKSSLDQNYDTVQQGLVGDNSDHVNVI